MISNKERASRLGKTDLNTPDISPMEKNRARVNSYGKTELTKKSFRITKLKGRGYIPEEWKTIRRIV